MKIYSLYTMMSVASKTKTKMYTTVILGFVAALSALPTWASTTPGITPITTVTPVGSTQQTSSQDLSVLRTKLKERFWWVAQEVRSLVNWETSVTEFFHESATVRTIDVNQGIGINPPNVGQDFFVDSENDPYRTYINRLAAYGVLSPSQKFYPQNYFRVDDFVGVVKKIAAKQHISLPADVLSLTTDDGMMTKWTLQQMIQLLGKHDIQIDGNPYDKLIRSEWAYYLVRMLDLPVLDVVDQTSSHLSLRDYFTDTLWHPFASAINTLASLDIINTQTNMFYPDNYLRHYDFVMIFVNSLLSFKTQSLANVSTSSFADVESTALYLPQLTYASDRWLIDYIVMSKRGQLYFQPNEFMTKHEVYQILSKTLNIQFSYNVQQADTQKITRAEMTQIIVESFWFQPKISQSESTIQDISDKEVTLLNTLKVLLSMI